MAFLSSATGLPCKSMQNAEILATPTLRNEKRNEREFLLQRPYININKHMNTMLHRFDIRANEHERCLKAMREELPRFRMQPLKAPHRALYADLIHLVKLGMLKRLELMGKDADYIHIFAHDPEQHFTLFTNRGELARRSRKSESAIHRQLQRLEEAGIVLMRKFHGVNRDFELLINPDFLIVSDQADLNFDPLLSCTENTQNKAARRGSQAKRLLLTLPQEQKNNEIMAVDSREGALRAGFTPPTPEGELKGIPACSSCTTGEVNGSGADNTCGEEAISRDESLMFFYRNSQVQAPVAVENKQGSPIQPLSDRICPPVAPAPPAETRDERHRKNTLLYTDWLLKYAISKLFSTHNHYRPAIATAFEMVASHYWSHCVTSQDFEQTFAVYRWRIDAAAKYAARSGFNLSNIYLTTYFNPTNMTGCSFARTHSWYVNAKKFKTKHEEDKKRAEVLKALTAKTKEVLEAANLSAFIRAESALKAKVDKGEFPEWAVNEFYRRCASLINNPQYQPYGSCSKN